ncbi:MAG: CDP-alcohol phosphatidyltransferase family protein [Candidatus Altiarchaeales archaeon]|nr:CDP-alcohol phosphatidyltransferase family protein [Candidatus Altiarchaeales archaeon]
MSNLGEQINIKIGLLFSKLGVPPNLWTLLSLIPALAGFNALLNQNLFAGLFYFVLSDILDVIDGAVARVTKSVSNLGAFLDGVMERYVEMLLYTGLLFYLWSAKPFILPNALWIVFLVFGALMIPYIKAYADHKKLVTEREEQRRMEGLYGRNGRILLMYFGMLLGCVNAMWLVYTIALTAFLVNLAALQRVFYVIKRRA